MYYYKDISIHEAISHIDEQSANNDDFVTTVGALVGGMIAPNKVKAEEGIITISKEGFQQLVSDRLGFSTGPFGSSSLTNATKLAMLHDLAEAKKYEEIKVRMMKGKDGLVADAILSDAYSILDSGTLLGMIITLMYQNALPKDTRVMTMALAPGGRYLDMRLRASEWDFTLDELGRPCNFLGNLFIKNDSKGKGKLEIRTGITRTACENSLIGSSIFSQIHKYSNQDDFFRTLVEGVTHINEYAREMLEKMNKMMNVTTDSPLLIFQKVGERLGIPQYALSRSEEDWRDQGENHNLYHIIQAIARGVQDMTFSANSKRQPKWDERARIEQEVWEEALMLNQMFDEGLGMDHYLICDSCHQRLPEPAE